MSPEKKEGAKGHYQVLASNSVSGEEGNDIITIKIDRALADVAMLRSITSTDYERLLDFILMNELIQANHRIDFGNSKRSDIPKKIYTIV